MWAIALRGFRANARRYIATLVAIVTGVGFLAAGFVVTDTAQATLGGDVRDRYSAVSAVVRMADSQTDSVGQLPAATVGSLAAVPGVDAVGGVIDGGLLVLDDNGRPVDRDSRGRLWISDEALNPLRIVDGVAPGAADEVALSRDLAEKRHVGVGDSIDIATTDGAVTVTVTGLTSLGDSDALDDGGTISLPAVAAFRYLNGGIEEYSQVLVRSESRSPQQLVDDLGPLAPPGSEVLTGEAFAKEQAGLAGGLVEAVRPALVVFSLLALFVCAFVIYNTFSVVITQRVRELALLRAVGATPKQVRRSVLVEGVAVGFTGSLVGLAIGAGLAFVVPRVLTRFGIDLPSVGIIISASTITWCMVSGTLITVVSVLGPAFKAGRTAPVEAMARTSEDPSGTSGFRRLMAFVMSGGGALALVSAGFGAPPAIIGFGLLAFFVGLVTAGPLLAEGLARLVRRPATATGITGQLATDNIERNPRRTAVTANALVIGLFLITLVSVAGATVHDWAVAEADKLSTADFVLTADAGEIPTRLVDAARTIPGVSTVAPVETISVADAKGNATSLVAGDLDALKAATGLKTSAGDPADLAAGGVAIMAISGDPSAPAIGDQKTFTTPDGRSVTLPVVALLDFSTENLLLDNLVSPATLGTLGASKTTAAFIRSDDGQRATVKDGLDGMVASYGNVTLEEGNTFGQILDQLINFLIDAVNALLLMSVVIALIGIINTLSLAIHERRHEIGLLRAVGMTPAEVRGMVRAEALLIAVLGTLTGVIGGSFTGWMLTRAIGGVALSVPWSRLALIVVAGVVVGALASIWPTRRASHLDILDSLRA